MKDVLLRHKNALIVFLQAVILIALTVFFISGRNSHEDIQIDLSSMTSDTAVFDENTGSWHIAGGNETGNAEDTPILQGPGIHLDHGTYTLHLEYLASDSQKMGLSLVDGDEAVYGKGKNILLDAQTFKLPSKVNSVDYNFGVKQSVDGFQLELYYSGNGDFSLNKACITHNMRSAKRTLLLLLLLFAAADSLIFFKKQIDENRNTIFLLASVIIFSSLPLWVDGTMTGKDFNYHIMRLESVAIELGRGIFPVFMNSAFFNGNGYPSSIYYNDIFMYIPALTRLCGFTVSEAYGIYIFLTNAATVLIAYYCFKRIFRDSSVGILLSLVYTVAPYRLLCIFVRSAVGEYSAMTFMPLLLLSMWMIYTQNDTYSVTEAALYMCLGMSGLIGTHILSVMMACWTMLAVCIVLFKTTFRIKTIKTYIMAVAGTVILSLYYVVPLLDYFINVDCNINHQVEKGTVLRIQHMGVEPAKFFAVFKDLFSNQSVHVAKSMQKTPGLILLAALFIAIYLWVNRELDKRGRFITVMSLILLFIASDVCPWDALSSHSRIVNLISQVQFPWRYLSILVLMLTLLLGILCRADIKAGGLCLSKRTVMLTAAAVTVVMSLFYLSNLMDDSIIKDIHDTAELRSDYVGGAEQYVRYGTDTGELGTDFEAENISDFEIISDLGSSIALKCGQCEDGAYVEIPRINYRGYVARLDDAPAVTACDGENNRARFYLPKGYSGEVRISYSAPFYWYLAWIISVCMMAAIVFYVILRHRNIRNPKTQKFLV